MDLAFFVVSLHHDPQGPPPTDAEVKSAARSFAQIWPAFPEKLVILMPAGPMIGSSTISRTDAFRNELSAAYGYEFNYAVTGTPFCNLGALTQAIITGGNWPLQDDGCVTHHFPPEAVGGPGYDTYGDFMVKSSTQEVSFHVLAAQTPGGNVNTKLVGQLMYLTDEGKVPRGSEPTFVAGDFNWPEGVPDEIDTTLGWTLETRANWLNCNRTCVKPAGRGAFVPGSDTPQKLELFQLNGATRLVPAAVQLDTANNALLHLDGLEHPAVGILFTVSDTPHENAKSCPPPAADPGR